jgi:hypothetical protein
MIHFYSNKIQDNLVLGFVHHYIPIFLNKYVDVFDVPFDMEYQYNPTTQKNQYLEK